MKEAFVDIGELGWSLLLSAHARWLKRQGQPVALTMTFSDRMCLYEGLADDVRAVPPSFNKEFGHGIASGFGLGHISADQVRGYFNKILAPEHFVSSKMSFRCVKPIFSGQIIFEPYAYKSNHSDKSEILIFPRYRSSVERNIPKTFYINLINLICDEFPDCFVRTIGRADGAYDIEEVRKNNYINCVGRSESIRDLIDSCQSAIVAVGSQSAPPKLSLLQGVPTFMIGHEKQRHIGAENWMDTKVGFYEIGGHSYDNFDSADCMSRIMDFIKECR